MKTEDLSHNQNIPLERSEYSQNNQILWQKRGCKHERLLYDFTSKQLDIN